jgi:oligosaccharide repeat unit polymerase
VFPVYWSVFLSATLVLQPTSTFDAHAAIIIVLFCGMFLFWATVATLGQPLSGGPGASNPWSFARKVPQLSGATIKWASAVGAVGNMTAALLALRNSQTSLADILTLQGLAESTNSLAVERYSGGQSDGLLVFLLLGIGYVAALVAPFVRLTESKRLIWWTILPALTSLAYAAVTSARLGFLVAAALTAGGVIACSVIRNGSAPRVRIKTAISVALVAVILGVLFTGIGVLRTGRLDTEVIQATTDKQASYTVGAVGAFSSWYIDYGTGMGRELGYGTATIAGMEYLTGQDRAATRAYGEFAIIDASGRTSNVYTVFRGLMLDFGIAGTLTFLAVAGFVFGRLYIKAVNGSIVAASLVGFGYASILFSGWMATTTFTNILVVTVAAPAVLLLSKRLEHGNRPFRRHQHGREFRRLPHHVL